MSRSFTCSLAACLLVAACGPGAVTPKIGAEVPEHGLFDATPATFRVVLRETNDRPTVVNVWASWCIPCKAEAPLLRADSERYGADVRFLGVDTRDTRDAADAFIDEYGWTYPSAFDPDGKIMVDLKVLGLPATLFYRADGELGLVHTGEIKADQLEEKIDAILRIEPKRSPDVSRSDEDR